MNVRTLKASAIVIMFLLAGCGNDNASEVADLDVTNLSTGFDFSSKDAATTEAEIIRLLGEGHVMYARLNVFNLGGVYIFDCRGSFASKPQVVCDSYPERIVVEAWESIDSSGVVKAFHG